MNYLKIIAKNLNLSLLLISVFALLFAYISQYIFHHHPCTLCYYQRWPFFAIISLIILGFFLAKNYQKLIFKICLLLLLLNSFIAIYHVGVEKKIFQGPSGCAAKDLNSYDNIEDLAKALKATKAVKCSEPTFFFLNLSMASWNVIYCLFFVITFAQIERWHGGNQNWRNHSKEK